MAISFAKKEISQIQDYRWIYRTSIALGHPFPQINVVNLISFKEYDPWNLLPCHLCHLGPIKSYDRPKKDQERLGALNSLLRPFIMELGQKPKNLGAFKSLHFAKSKNSNFFHTNHL
jgi:hypothetical protein